jgi:hypothetical protein
VDKCQFADQYARCTQIWRSKLAARSPTRTYKKKPSHSLSALASYRADGTLCVLREAGFGTAHNQTDFIFALLDFPKTYCGWHKNFSAQSLVSFE